MKRSKHNKSPTPKNFLPAVTWTPVFSYPDRRKWRNKVTTHGGMVLGVLWASRKWPHLTEPPLFLGVAFWAAGLPLDASENFNVFKNDDIDCVMMRDQAFRATYLMYASVWIMVAAFAVDRNHDVVVRLAVGMIATLVFIWRIYKTRRLAKWLVKN